LKSPCSFLAAQVWASTTPRTSCENHKAEYSFPALRTLELPPVPHTCFLKKVAGVTGSFDVICRAPPAESFYRHAVQLLELVEMELPTRENSRSSRADDTAYVSHIASRRHRRLCISLRHGHRECGSSISGLVASSTFRANSDLGVRTLLHLNLHVRRPL